MIIFKFTKVVYSITFHSLLLFLINLRERNKIISFFIISYQKSYTIAGGSNPWPTGHMQLEMAMNVAQLKIVNSLKTFFGSSVCVAQENSSSSSVAQRCQKVGHPC